jgi:hypothetical protein
LDLEGLKDFLVRASKAELWKKSIALIVLLGIILTIVLPGTVPNEYLRVVNGQNYLGQTYTESAIPNSVGSINTQSMWSLGSSSSASTVQLGSSSVTTFSGTLKPDSSATSVSITTKLSVNLTEYPIMFLQIEVTKGLGYGVRFYSSENNKSIPLWSNADVLDHRKGTGQLENIQVNLQLLSKLNTGNEALNVDEMQIYVERSASTTPTPFTVVIEKLQFLTYNITTAPATGGSYRAVYFPFNLPNDSSWTLSKIDLVLDVSASAGASYEIYQFNGTSTTTGTVYHYGKTLASYQYSIYPSKGSAIALPDSVPPTGNYSLIVVALSGVLYSVQLSSASFVYTPSLSTSPTTSQTANSWWYVYLLLFIFALPLSIALLLYRRYRNDQEIRVWHIAIAIAVGLGCRFALAPIAEQPFDLMIYASSARGWFGYAIPNTSYGPTLPLTFLLYWIPYSFYALLLKLGFQDFFILGHPVGFVESMFLKGFPIFSDLFVFYLLSNFARSSRGKALAFMFFLNPLSIYVSSVWGQYEAATISLVTLGFLYLFRDDSRLSNEFKSSLAFVFSALIEVVGLIPMALLLAKNVVSKQSKPLETLLLASPLVLLFVYPPEWHMIYLLFSASVGASSVLLFGNPHTPYTIFSNIPGLAAYHPLIFLFAALGIGYIALRKFDLQNTIGFTFCGFLIFLLFAGQEPQWWLFLIPLGIMYAIVTEKNGPGLYMLVFGTMVAFLILSFTQGSGYILFGNANLNLFPLIESAKHGIDIYTVTTTVGGLVSLGYMTLGGRMSGRLPSALGASLVLFGTALLSFFMFAVMGVSI